MNGPIVRWKLWALWYWLKAKKNKRIYNKGGYHRSSKTVKPLLFTIFMTHHSSVLAVPPTIKFPEKLFRLLACILPLSLIIFHLLPTALNYTPLRHLYLWSLSRHLLFCTESFSQWEVSFTNTELKYCPNSVGFFFSFWSTFKAHKWLGLGTFSILASE